MVLASYLPGLIRRYLHANFRSRTEFTSNYVQSRTHISAAEAQPCSIPAHGYTARQGRSTRLRLHWQQTAPHSAPNSQVLTSPTLSHWLHLQSSLTLNSSSPRSVANGLTETKAAEAQARTSSPGGRSRPTGMERRPRQQLLRVLQAHVQDHQTQEAGLAH